MQNEQREIIIPVAVTVAGSELEIPISVAVTLDELVDVVVEHLNSGRDVRELLVAHYARSFYEEEGGGAAPPAEPSTGTEDESGRRNGRRKGEPPTFTPEELAAVDLEVEPPYSGRGKKSRQRQLWEAALQQKSQEGEVLS